MRPMSSAGAGRVRPANCSRAVSGTDRVATTQTANSSATAIAAAPATQGPSTGSGRRFQAASVDRVAAMPRTSTKSSPRMPPASTGGADPLSGSARAQTHLRHAPDRLGGDLPRHLAGAGFAVVEHDRHLAHAKAVAAGAVGQLDLERVALRAHGVELDGLQDLAAKALEAAGEVADLEAEDLLGVPAAAA